MDPWTLSSCAGKAPGPVWTSFVVDPTFVGSCSPAGGDRSIDDVAPDRRHEHTRRHLIWATRP